MNPYNQSGTKSTPIISFDSGSGQFKIEGRSMPEDAFSFYKEAINWMEDYVENPHEQTNFEIKLDYFNSGSVKQVFTLLCMLEDILEAGKEVNVNWYYKSGDELMHQKGHEFVKFLDIPMQVVEY